MLNLPFLLFFCIFSASATHTMRCWNKPVCYCDSQLRKWIICRGVADVTDLEDFLKKQPSAGKLQLSGSFTTIPSMAFDGFTATTLAIQAPLGDDIPTDCLSGIKSLRIVNFKHCRFTKVPPALSNRNFEVLQLTGGLLSGIETQLQNMTSTVHILLSNNVISTIQPDSFRGTLNVEHLDLSFNKLFHLDPEVFAPLKLLKVIDLHNNWLYTVDGYFKNLNPKRVNLYGNNLTNIDGAFHRGMWTMRYLDLGSNPRLRLTPSSFNGSMQSLFQLELSDGGLTEVDPDLLRYFPKLLDLSLNRNNLTTLPDGFFRHTPSLHVLQLSDNRLRSIDGLQRKGKPASSWRTVALGGNLLESVAFGEDFSAATSIDLSRNSIRGIQREEISPLRKLIYFNLSSNILKELRSGCFGDLRNLKTLDLSWNFVKSLNGSIRNNISLRNLVISSASLESLSADEFGEDSRIKFVNVRNNSLSTVYRSFTNLMRIYNLDLSMNNLTTLTKDSFYLTRNQRSIRLREIWMADNPWSCDCRLGWIAQWLKKRGTQLQDEPVCSSPDHLRGRKIRTLNATDFRRWADECPEHCDCFCRESGQNLGTSVECGNKRLKGVPDTLPANALSLDLNHNEIESFNGLRVKELEELGSLNLEHNKIAKVTFYLPGKISSIRLAGNRLRTIPQDELSRLTSLTRVTLSQNPWSCNCETWRFRNWLINHSDLVPDALNIRCGPNEGFLLKNKIIISLSQSDLCSSLPLSMIIIITVSLVLFVGACVLCCCYRHSLAALLYSLGCRCLKAEPAIQDEMPYDAFLLYSAEEQDVAGEIAKGLEDEIYKFRVCVPNRDIPSPRTPEKISAYILQCSKLVVLMSRNFLDNDNQVNLLKSAMSFSLDVSAQGIIFIMCDILSQPQEIDPIVKTLMKNNNCLQWEKRFFWQRLIYQLPKKKLNMFGHPEEERFLQ